MDAGQITEQRDLPNGVAGPLREIDGPRRVERRLGALRLRIERQVPQRSPEGPVPGGRGTPYFGRGRGLGTPYSARARGSGSAVGAGCAVGAGEGPGAGSTAPGQELPEAEGAGSALGVGAAVGAGVGLVVAVVLGTTAGSAGGGVFSQAAVRSVATASAAAPVAWLRCSQNGQAAPSRT